MHSNPASSPPANRPAALRIASLAIGVFVIAVNAIASSGQVVDEENGKPLEGVYVMAEWKASAFNPVDSKTVCYHFAITQTDKEGRYTLPDWSWSLNPFLTNRERYLDYYLAGYEQSSKRNRYDEDNMVLRRHAKSVEERLKSLFGGDPEACIPEHQRKAKLLPLYRAQYEEAKKIAVTPKERELAEIFRASMISAEFGWNAYTNMQMQKDTRVKP